MSILSKLEKALERLIEGSLLEPLAGRLHPIEIAKKLSREMQSRKEVSVLKTYVPNSFTIKLNPYDCEPLKSLGKALKDEILQYLINEAAEKDYHFAAGPEIKFVEDASVKKGHFEIESRFLSGAESASAFLEITEGFDKGKTFFLQKERYSIGRSESTAIVIGDPKNSKEHAVLYWEKNSFFLEDLGSKNGTIVNGKKIEKVSLKDKDTITLGFTTIKFNILE